MIELFANKNASSSTYPHSLSKHSIYTHSID